MGTEKLCLPACLPHAWKGIRNGILSVRRVGLVVWLGGE